MSTPRRFERWVGRGRLRKRSAPGLVGRGRFQLCGAMRASRPARTAQPRCGNPCSAMTVACHPEPAGEGLAPPVVSERFSGGASPSPTLLLSLSRPYASGFGGQRRLIHRRDLVVASSVSFAPAPARELARSAAPPPHCANASLVCAMGLDGKTSIAPSKRRGLFFLTTRAKRGKIYHNDLSKGEPL